MIRFTSTLCVALVSAGAAVAQQPAPPPGCTAAEHRQFDFWEGDWIVTDSAGGTTYGTNLVTREEQGCLLHEHWTASGVAQTGQSMNFYDRTSGKWNQVWVASGGNVLRLEGRLEGRAMQLEGQRPGQGGVMIRNRITWTPEPDGRVRQTWSTSQDGGQTWQVGFDGWYRRKAT